MEKTLVTNILLAIIAVLLLTQIVLHNSSARMIAPVMMQEAPSTQQMGSAPPPPMQGGMFFQAIRAFPSDCGAAQTLGDCDSPEALLIKNKIENYVNSGKSTREVFDWIVKSWGEKVLTDEAIQIRKMRRARSPH